MNSKNSVMKKCYLSLLAIAIAFSAQMGIKAQVTIGSLQRSNTGALLDLKQEEDDIAKNGGRTASKGLGLPRVKLTKLVPETPAELSASIGSTGNWELEDHIGLIVYNAVPDQCKSTPIEGGTHVFDGKEWQPLEERRTYLRESAMNSDRTDWESAWGDNIVIHNEKKDGSGEVIYQEFISSSFGQAGRWMTTNIAAYKYDTDLPQTQYHSAGRELEGASGNPNDELNGAYWAYPKTGSPITDGEGPSAQFLENPYIGLLYTWDAATAGKGGSTGKLNVDSPNPSSESYENGLPEWDGTGTQPANTQKRRQGICPKGWHVPSDYEWTELERELIRNTSLYADMENIDNGDGTELAKVQQPPNPGSTVGEQQLVTDEQQGLIEDLFRGSTHGEAIRGACVAPGSTRPTLGKSSISHRGGFNIILTGRVPIQLAQVAGYGNFSMPWSSSSFADTPPAGEDVSYVAICRNIRRDDGRIYRAAYKREYMNSVRCKKD